MPCLHALCLLRVSYTGAASSRKKKVSFNFKLHI
uniref:Uncharacterized protein n=1 Tax=Anguilla anguilla TaxID=7936 RepID=A0A0E9VPX6_ANGAN